MRSSTRVAVSPRRGHAHERTAILLGPRDRGRRFVTGHQPLVRIHERVGDRAKALRVLHEMERRPWRQSGQLPYYVDRVTARGDEWVEVERDFDLAREPYLATAARLNGVPVLPGSFQMEIAAEVAKLLRPGMVVRGLSDFEFSAAFKLFDGRRRTLKVRAALVESSDQSARIECRFTSPTSAAGLKLADDVLHSVVRVELSNANASATMPSPIAFDEASAVREPDLPGAFYYRRSPLRLGAGFTAVWHTRRDGRTRSSIYDNPYPLHHMAFEHHLIAPLLLDAALQGCTSAADDCVEMGIPKRVGSVRLAGELADRALNARRLAIVTAEGSPEETNQWEVRVCDRDSGEVLVAISGFESFPLGHLHAPTGRLLTADDARPSSRTLFRGAPEFVPAPTASQRGRARLLRPSTIIAVDVGSAQALVTAAPTEAVSFGPEILLPSIDEDTFVEVHLAVQHVPAPNDLRSWDAMESILRNLHAAAAALPEQAKAVFIVRGAFSNECPVRLIPAAALALGFIKSVAQERPRGATRLCVCDDITLAEARRLAQSEDWTAEPESAVRFFKQGQEWVERHRELLPLTSETRALDSSDLVLITGGTGGLGLAAARALHRRYACELVLVGRTEFQDDTTVLPPPATFAEYLASCTPEERQHGIASLRTTYSGWVRRFETFAALRELRAEGARVRYRAVDVSDATEVATLVLELGRIAAVVHAAGSQRAATARTKQWAEVRTWSRSRCGEPSISCMRSAIGRPRCG